MKTQSVVRSTVGAAHFRIRFDVAELRISWYSSSRSRLYVPAPGSVLISSTLIRRALAWESSATDAGAIKHEFPETLTKGRLSFMRRTSSRSSSVVRVDSSRSSRVGGGGVVSMMWACFKASEQLSVQHLILLSSHSRKRTARSILEDESHKRFGIDQVRSSPVVV